MEFKLTQETICIHRELFRNSSEQPIDLDITLPDYCPDISKILKCQVQPQITQRQLVGDRLSVEGTTWIRIFYTSDEVPGIRNCELTSAFSAEFPIKSPVEAPLFFTETKVNFVNCRAVTRRRVDIHGSFSIVGKITGLQQEEFLGDAEGEGIQTKRCPISVSSVSGTAQQSFAFHETIPIESSKKSPESLLRSEATVILRDYKAIPNKLIVKGDLCARFLCLTDLDGGTPEVFEYTLPISQILDIDGIEEDCQCSIDLQVLSTRAQILPTGTGDVPSFDMECNLSLCAAGYKKVEKQVVQDAYSTKYGLELQRTPLELQKYLCFLEEVLHLKEIIELPAKYDELIDLWGEVVSDACTISERQLHIDGKINLCLLLSREKTPEYLERTIDFHFCREDPSFENEVSCYPKLTLCGLNGRIGEHSLELRGDLFLFGEVFAPVRCDAIVSAQPVEEERKDCENAPTLRIYYAEPGESVWEISKSYNIPVHAVLSENNLSDDYIDQRRMLLLPNCEVSSAG